MPNKSPFHRPNRLEEVYRSEIERLLSNYFNIPTPTTLGELNARLVEYAQASNFLKGFANNLATRMVTMTLQQNATSWRKAASQGSQGKLIYGMLRNELRGTLEMQVRGLVKENSRLITTLPKRISAVISQHIQERQMQGIRSEQIMREIGPKMRDLKRYQIARIARTEVAKADTAVTRVRAESIGLSWYQWQTSEDQRVRDSHRHMDLVLINWNNAPSPELLSKEKSQGRYHAGNIYNCRCVALPLVSLAEIKFPAKVYVGNQIKLLTIKQFSLISGLQQRIAA